MHECQLRSRKTVVKFNTCHGAMKVLLFSPVCCYRTQAGFANAGVSGPATTGDNAHLSLPPRPSPPRKPPVNRSAQPQQKEEAHKINHRIDSRDVRLINAEGLNVGVVPTRQAIAMAEEAGLDLVEISPDASPPVAKILDYGKFKFQEQKRLAEARKKQKVIELKEIKIRPMIDDHDYQVKLKSARRFFEEGDKVKVTLRFRGREMDHQQLGHQLLQRVKGDLGDISKVELEPRSEGRQIIMILSPRSKS
jgi:translation initiation factor IF-3